jgi:hypothetical protein
VAANLICTHLLFLYALVASLVRCHSEPSRESETVRNLLVPRTQQSLPSAKPKTSLHSGRRNDMGLWCDFAANRTGKENENNVLR